MTEREFWKCLDIAWEQHNTKKIYELLQTYPQYISKAMEAYMQRLQDDAVFREQQDKQWQEGRIRLVEALGEDWVNEHCTD